jgi:hypothetical protein
MDVVQDIHTLEQKLGGKSPQMSIFDTTEPFVFGRENLSQPLVDIMFDFPSALTCPASFPGHRNHPFRIPRWHRQNRSYHTHKEKVTLTLKVMIFLTLHFNNFTTKLSCIAVVYTAKQFDQWSEMIPATLPPG